MNVIRSLIRASCYAFVLSCCALVANGATITLDSNSSTVFYGTYPTGAATYNIGTGGGVWAGPIGTSSWVSFNPNTYPGGGVTPPNGTYNYYDAFTAAAGDIGSITVLADDTTSVYLNGFLIAPSAPIISDPAVPCTIGTPNCATYATYVLPQSDFLNGTNVLSFGVQQAFGAATGLDFEATIGPTPEPSSILMLGTGLLSAAGMVRRRIKA